MLKGRLKELADCYEGESVVWDIGCDHAQLGLSFVDHPQIKEIHLVDPSTEVMKNHYSNKQLDSYITSGKLFLHQDYGQRILVESESNLIFIAGMGGKEIISILQELEKSSPYSYNVVISPHKNILEVREYLHSSRYRLKTEFVISDQGRFYQVLNLDFSSQDLVSSYGKDIWVGPHASSYRDYLLAVYENHQDSSGKAYFRFLKSLTF